MKQAKLVDFEVKSRVAPNQKIYDYLLKQIRLSDPQIDLINITQNMKRNLAQLQCSPEQIEFFRILMKITNCKKGIEIGTFTGFSALGFALGLPADGKLICCDISEEYAKIGQKYWEAAGVDKIIEFRLGTGAETINKLLQTEKGTFDFGFVDADKGNYKNYYEGIIQLLKPGGFLIIDNVLWEGFVCEKPEDLKQVVTDAITNEKHLRTEPENFQKVVDFYYEYTKVMIDFNELITNDNRVESVMLTVADGITIVRKK